MSSIDKSIVSILEGDIESIDYGVPEFNKLFKGLDSKTKKKLIQDFPPDKQDNKDIHVGVLKNIRDPEIQEVWNELSQEEKDNLDKKNIRDKYLTLRYMLNQKKKKPIRPPSSSSEEKSESSSPLSESTKAKIAIIIPFRDMEKEKKRTKQLNNLVEYFATYLKDDEYKIFLVEQSNDSRKFNRGQLLNIGFEYAVKEGYNNFIFHDVDLLPSEELKEYYENIPQDKPVHIAAVWDRYGSNPKYFGGIVAFNKKMFERINGYPNDFWGWGGEDDAMYNRLAINNIPVINSTKNLIGFGIGAYGGLGLNINLNSQFTAQFLYSPSQEKVNIGNNPTLKIQNGVGFRLYYNF